MLKYIFFSIIFLNAYHALLPMNNTNKKRNTIFTIVDPKARPKGRTKRIVPGTACFVFHPNGSEQQNCKTSLAGTLPSTEIQKMLPNFSSFKIQLNQPSPQHKPTELLVTKRKREEEIDISKASKSSQELNIQQLKDTFMQFQEYAKNSLTGQKPNPTIQRNSFSFSREE